MISVFLKPWPSSACRIAPMRPSIMSEGAITSQPARPARAPGGERFERGVVGDLVADQQAVMAVGGVRVERHVANDADVGRARLDRPHRAAYEVVGIEGFGGPLVAEVRIGVGKQREGGNAQVGGLFRRRGGEVDRQPLDARHGGDRLPRLLAVHDEDRPDQVGGRERGLRHERARPSRLPRAPHPRGRIAAGWPLRKDDATARKIERGRFCCYRHSLTPETGCLYDGKALDTRGTKELEQTQNTGEGRRNSLPVTTSKRSKKSGSVLRPGSPVSRAPQRNGQAPFGRLLAFFLRLPQMLGMAKVKIMVNGETRTDGSAHARRTVPRAWPFAGPEGCDGAERRVRAGQVARATVSLAEGDAIEVLSPRQGG